MKRKVELLSPVGDFECLVAAVQNGADAVYFGASKFNARMNSTNFEGENLKKAIEYAKLRNVKTNLTLNTLIKNDEFEEATKLLKYAYECGIDAIIMQDLGLARFAIKNFPDLEIHASTQMTAHNVEGVETLKKLGFKRVVLSRELNINEIRNIYEKTKMDLEVFIHGALCISYSGQCLMSSIIGQRSGNRGKCAGTCRLPYELINKDMDKTLDRGYLLSSKDVCTLDILPEIIKTGAMSFKIEGRMKTPEYVGTVTKIYRKYIDLALSGKEYKVDEADRKLLMQVFNRGGFCTGYLNGKLGKEMMYKDRPNHIGIKLGRVLSYNPNKGHVKVKLEEGIMLGDSIRINESSCKTSELMDGNTNLKTANKGRIVTIGRIKGKIRVGDWIYKTVAINIENEIKQICSKENIKRKIDCIIKIETGKPLELKIKDIETNLEVEELGGIVEEAKTIGIDDDRVKEQISKTGGTVFEVLNIEIKKSKNAFISIKELNELRRKALDELEEKILKTFNRKEKKIEVEKLNIKDTTKSTTQISLLLNYINTNYNYKNLEHLNKVYIQASELLLNKNKEKLEEITSIADTYIYMPNVLRDEHKSIIYNKIDEIIKSYKIKGFVVSNLSQIEELKKYNLELLGNYTLNVYNNNTIEELRKMGLKSVTISPEINSEEIRNIKTDINKELIVYGRLPLMTSEYCPIGTFKNCTGLCQKGDYVLKDRMNFEFPIRTNRLNCNTIIYNSKITSIKWKDLKVDSIRIDILDESLEEINRIIKIHKQNERLEGYEFTNGNLNKIV